MPNKRDDRLRPHLSALVDGELEPLEVIALQRHLRSHPELREEHRDLEQLKLAVHLVGRRDVEPVGLKTRLRAQIHAAAEAQLAKRRQRRWLMPLSAAAMAVVALVLGFAIADRSDGPGQPAPMLAEITLDDAVLEQMIQVHRGELPPLGLRDLVVGGALVGVETLPDGFVTRTRGPGTPIVQASHTGGACYELPVGATLIELRVDRVDLPTSITTALEGQGVYVEEVDGIEVRITSNGDKLFVLLHEPHEPDSSPI